MDLTGRYIYDTTPRISGYRYEEHVSQVTDRPWRRVVVIVLSVVLWAGTPISAAAVYTNSRSSGVQGTRFASIYRSGSYDGVIGDAVARNLLPCFSPSSTKYDFPAVLPANLQRSGAFGLPGPNIVQLGWSRCSAGGNCGGITADNVNHFIYTPSDQGGGAAAVADGWAGGAPTLGHWSQVQDLRFV